MPRLPSFVISIPDAGIFLKNIFLPRRWRSPCKAGCTRLARCRKFFLTFLFLRCYNTFGGGCVRVSGLPRLFYWVNVIQDFFAVCGYGNMKCRFPHGVLSGSSTIENFFLTYLLCTAYTVHRNIGSCGAVIPASSGLIVKVKRESGVFFYGNNIVKILLPVRCVPNHMHSSVRCFLHQPDASASAEFHLAVVDLEPPLAVSALEPSGLPEDAVRCASCAAGQLFA